MFGFGRKKYAAMDQEALVDYKKKYEDSQKRYDDFYSATQLANKQKEQDNAIATAKLTSSHELTVAKLKNDNELSLSQKEFEIKHVADERVKAAEGESADAKLALAVAKKENEMLTKVTDLNKDIVDVKDLINKLFELLGNKLPEVKISGMLGAAPAGKQENNKQEKQEKSN